MNERELLNLVLEVYNDLSHNDSIEPVSGSLRLTAADVEDRLLQALLYNLADNGCMGDKVDLETEVLPILQSHAELLDHLVERVEDDMEANERERLRESDVE